MRPPPTRLSRKKRLVFSGIVLLLTLSLLELGARVVELAVPPRALDFGLGFNQESRVFIPYEKDRRMMVTAPEKRTSFQLQGFPLEKAEGTLRIAALGGSTVTYLQPELRVLRERLRGELSPRYRDVEIINAGGLAYGSLRMVNVALEIFTYRPDVLILYTGQNEFEEIEQLQLASLETVGLYRTASHLALIRLSTELVTSFRVARLWREHNRRLRDPSETARAWRYRFTAEDVAKRMSAFQANTALVIREARKRNIAVVLGTSPSNLVKPYLPEQDRQRYQEVRDLLKAGAFAEARALGRRLLAQTVGRHQASDLENDILRELARDNGLPLADVEAAIAAAEPHGVPGETLFIDQCHLSEAGNRIVREAFERTLLQLLRGPTSGGAGP